MNTKRQPTRIVVIGAGITGLTAGFRLLENSRNQNTPIDLTILEASDRVGGTIKTETLDNFLLEHGPDNFITNKPAGLDLCKSLGIDNELIQTNAEHRGALIVRKGKLLPIPPGFELMMPRKLWPFAMSPVLSWGGKLRALRERFIPCRQNASYDDDESLASFVTRRFGKQVLDRLVQPLVGGIYTADPETLSLRATVPRFLDMERDHGSLIKAAFVQARQQEKANTQAAQVATGARYSLFMTLKGGMGQLTDALADELGDRVKTSTPVESVTRAAPDGMGQGDANWIVTCKGGNAIQADAVLMTTPSYLAADLIQSIDQSLADELKTIKYASSAVIVATYKRSQITHPLNAFGFVVPELEQRKIIAGAFASVKYAGRAPDDHVVIRAFLGGVTQPDILDQTDDELIKTATDELSSLLQIKDRPQITRLRRYDQAMPQYHVGHVQKIKAIRQCLANYDGLELAGNAYDGVGIPDCIASAQAAVDRLASQFNA